MPTRKEKLRKVFLQTLRAKKRDRILVLYDSRQKEKIARQFSSALHGFPVSLLGMRRTGQHGKEPERRAASAMKQHDVVIAVTTYSLTHTASVRNARKARVASMPGFENRMMHCLLVDYRKLRKTTTRLAKKLEKGSAVEVITPSGTDLQFSIKGCRVTPSYGIAEKDHVVNLPDGEVFLPPKKMNGVLVFDSYGSAIRKPTRLIVKNNRIAEFQKNWNGNYMKKILGKKNDRFVAEFGIGTNGAAKLIGNVLEDEKVLGTCHIAFGNNLGFGGSNASNVHIDVILNKPTIWIDGKAIMKKGEPLW
ncbi:MAG: aminopeptidase [Candidatus Aenigmarchaeota archaeon]|nr:aminopeptidase [Candidatus Aenigmarchaeota archaeon]